MHRHMTNYDKLNTKGSLNAQISTLAKTLQCKHSKGSQRNLPSLVQTRRRPATPISRFYQVLFCLLINAQVCPVYLCHTNKMRLLWSVKSEVTLNNHAHAKYT